MGKFKDITGQRFGRLLVLSIVAERTKQNRIQWLCSCDCGKEWTVIGHNLTNGRQKSCPCRKNQLAAERHYVHGMVHKREYRIWSGIKKRCFNPKEPAYKNYGERGITMCDEWKKDFMAFYRDMGPCPDGFTIDRINNDGNYEPGNCRWTTRVIQNRNRRDVVMLTHDGETMSLRDWADRMHMNFDKLRYRYEHHIEPLFGSARRLSPSERDEIREAYSSGKETGPALAARFKVGCQTIYNVIHRKNITDRQRQ